MYRSTLYPFHSFWKWSLGKTSFINQDLYLYDLSPGWAFPGFLVFASVPLIFRCLMGKTKDPTFGFTQEHSLSTFFTLLSLPLDIHYLNVLYISTFFTSTFFTSTFFTSTFFTSHSLNHDFCRLTSGLGHDQLYSHHQTFGSIPVFTPTFLSSSWHHSPSSCTPYVLYRSG